MLKTFIFLLLCLDFLQSASVDNKKDHIREKRLLSEKEHFDGDHHHDADYDHEAFLGIVLAYFNVFEYYKNFTNHLPNARIAKKIVNGEEIFPQP